MSRGIVAILGNLKIDRSLLGETAAQFGWTIAEAPDLKLLKNMSGGQEVVAVLFNAKNLRLSWQDSLECVLETAPQALPIACAGFSEHIPWTELVEAGAFHELRIPFEPSEVKRSLGFVWAAKRQRGGVTRAVGSRDTPVRRAGSPGRNGFVFSDDPVSVEDELPIG